MKLAPIRLDEMRENTEGQADACLPGPRRAVPRGVLAMLLIGAVRNAVGVVGWSATDNKPAQSAVPASPGGAMCPHALGRTFRVLLPILLSVHVAALAISERMLEFWGK